MNCAIIISLFLLNALMSLHQCLSDEMVVSTYNIWNIMFNWKTRKYRIADLIRESDSDFIAFQEVRIDKDDSHSQISELQKLLPEYRWKVCKSAHVASKMSGTIWSGWEKEGIGILSKKRVVYTNVVTLSHDDGPDTNKRIALHVTVDTGDGRVINLVVLHLSYHRQQQCRNAADVLLYIASRNLKDVIILGDMNIYNDYSWPMRIFTDRNIKGNNPCAPYTQKLTKKNRTVFYDTWETSNSTEKGFTFSNMPTPGYESRPDRILASRAFDTVHRKLHGNGVTYKQSYFKTIRDNRIKSVIKNSYYAFKGISGYTCVQDCGPRGSCRCGVCVKGGNSNNCDLPNCSECGRAVFVKMILYLLLFLLILTLTLYSALQILIVSAKFNPETFFSIMGFTCCLFNPKLYSFKRLVSRHKLLRWCKFLQYVNIPPMFLLVVSVSGLIVLFLLYERIFDASFQTVDAIMEEEFYPSDHLMYSVHLRLKL